MRFVLFALAVLLVIGACSVGYWPAKDVYRPRAIVWHQMQHFKGKRHPLLDTAHLYISTRKATVQGKPGRIEYYGFYANGRLIMGRTDSSHMATDLATRNSAASAFAIGTHTARGDSIFVQPFLPGRFKYIEWRGIVRRDTVILTQLHQQDFTLKEIRIIDTLMRTSYLLKP